ncbi:MAG: hypothetical protein HXY40_05160 [Chloroflexi bacterium]|nr:hypothetical protein [Chloroflexota bacterium]
MATRLRHLLQRMLRGRYAWALLPALVVGALALNNHQYYDLFLGYDMPQHFMNVHIIMQTGGLPTPENNPRDNYEAHQAPIYYILAAWVLIVGKPFFGDPMLHLMPAVLCALSLLWLALLAHVIEHVLRRVHGLVKALTLAVIMLMPMHIMARAMFGNDLPELMLGTLAAVALWRIVRSGRTHERGAWLRAAALCGLAVAFKNNGLVLAGTYLALAAALALRTRLRGYARHARGILRAAAWGVPLLLLPFAVNYLQTSRFLDDPIGAMGVRPPAQPRNQINHVRFLLSFDATLVLLPLAYEHGQRGYWSLHYVTLHSDYYNHWNTVAYRAWDVNALTAMPHRFPAPIARVNDLLLLQWLALPVTGVMGFGLLYAVYRCAFKWRYATRDGSLLLLLFTLVAHAAQIVRYLRYPYVEAVVIHARYLGFWWFFVFLFGIYALARVLRGRAIAQGFVVGIGACLLLAYCFIALRAFWLPPLW